MEKGLHGDGHSLFGLFRDFVSHPVMSLKQLFSLKTGSVSSIAENAHRLRDALVFGNTAIIQDIGPAYSVFLQAESAGQNGVEALRAKGYGHAPLDPQGFKLEAFKSYRQAKELGRAEGSVASHHYGNRMQITESEVADLQMERRRLLDRANALLGFQEQWFSLQRPEVFGNPETHALMARLTPYMAVQDAHGLHGLLLKGGNWADFLTRMGLVELKPGDARYDDPAVIRFKDDQGATHHYLSTYALKGMRCSPDDKQNDAILSYMTSARDAELIAGKPMPLPTRYGSP
jgi:hypothetical protein